MDNFKTWLAQRNMGKGAISSVCARVKRISKYYDIIAEYHKDKCVELLYDFTYTTEDADNGILPNVKIQIDGSYVVGLSALKNALKLYVEYLDDCDVQDWVALQQTEKKEKDKKKSGNKKQSDILSFYVGSFDDFNAYVGPKCRNIVQAMTKSLKRNAPVCECCRQVLPLQAAHKHGFERLDIIKRLLDSGTIIAPDVYRVDLVEFEKQFINEHQPIKDKIYFLCEKCHKIYDKGSLIQQQQIENEVLTNRKKFPTP